MTREDRQVPGPDGGASFAGCRAHVRVVQRARCHDQSVAVREQSAALGTREGWRSPGIQRCEVGKMCPMPDM